MLGGEREERVTVEVIDELLKSMEVGLAFRNYNGRISSMDFHSPQLQGHRRCRPAALISHLDVAHFAWIVDSRARGNKFTESVCSNDIGGHSTRLWVGETDDDQELIVLAVLHQSTVVPSCDRVDICSFSFGAAAVEPIRRGIIKGMS